jgi:heme oxygenase
MGTHDKISLTGKKVPMVDTKKLDNVYRSMTWQERIAEMGRMRKMVMNDMLGLGWGKDQEDETGNQQQNN